MTENADRNSPLKLVTGEYHGLPDYAPIGLSLPVVENSVTQIAAGPFVCGGQFVSNGEVFAGRALVDARAVGRTVLRQDSIGKRTPKSGRVRDAARIVRAAEERFVEAGAKPISLADLCTAAGVSKNTLYLAFKSHCGETPIVKL